MFRGLSVSACFRVCVVLGVPASGLHDILETNEQTLVDDVVDGIG